MKIRLTIPTVNLQPTGRPQHCRSCGHWRLHRHGTVTKPVTDHRQERVTVERYRCCGCGRTFRHYPEGVSRATQSQRTVVLAALLYGLGLSCSAASHVLSALGVELCAMTVWRDAQLAGRALRATRPAGQVRVLGVDETIYRVKGREVTVGFVTDGQSGMTLDVTVLAATDRAAFERWLAPYVAQYGVEAVISDEHASYGVVTADLGLEHQLCLTHVRKAVANRCRAIRTQARDEDWDGPALTQLAADLARVRELVRTLPADGGGELETLARRYRDVPGPGRGEHASAAYRMRLLLVELWEHWTKLRLYRARPELGLDGTNNGTERAIGKSKLRYRTMRGYKSLDGLRNGIALTQWLYSGAEQHDLGTVLAT